MVNLDRFHLQPADRSGAAAAAPPVRVYTDFFRFRCPPFAITPDPEFLFLAETHQNAIEKIQYGIRSRQGFMLLTGEVGTGKSTLCRVVLDLLQETAQTVYVINPSLSTAELFATILDDLGIPRSGTPSKKNLIDQLNAYLLARAADQPVVIIIDDAQGMSPATLEDMRLLSNLETDKDKLLQVLLVGQPELRDQIETPRMRQLRQRIAVNCHLDFLKVEEVGRYIERRLFIAGNHGQVRFTPRLVKQIHRASQGIPRLINKICDLALTAAYTADSAVVDVPHLRAARGEISELVTPRGGGRPTGFIKRAAALTGLTAAILLGAGSYTLLKAPAVPDGGAMPVYRAIGPAAEIAPAEMAIPARTAAAADAPTGPRAGSYILQLGSYKSLDTTLRAVDIYAQKKIAAYWANLPGDDGIVWYRVFTGRFESREQAQRYRQVHALQSAAVKFAPWTVAVGEGGSAEQMRGLREFLKVYGLDGYVVQGEGDRRHMLSGAFLSRDGAEALADRIRRQTGIAARIADLGGEGVGEKRPQPTNPGGHSS